ncbi:DUF3540 domain-containing protein [Pseudomonas plecoglossicida]|uniref:DUF3540 domain-containing protein n=1 Tax=Pseudomonas plecoglossicida TaxID=70775 RepID=A0AAD0VRW5_PSEDL|nr:DUF3540 domain-containing protein [Pseudomonas plecoglossicida]AXM95519.1 DUF3540 domain-containing protein [Pseudomonas plecoglossicida]EPB94322.1 hypothetical protein L321_18292 [Pseudomonas plecoglossicida NB2011]QLB56267.1 DUF3540 domain-containing protein [Pseudomonas plecoglossicida]GLR37878.1 hypothetical protein GCM10011247_32760 [Pseudomonas plecoglossicida]
MNDAQPVRNGPVRLCHARINAFDGHRFGMVSGEGHRYWLKPAVGCLLQPAVGDCVLVSLAGDEGFILSVLERGQAQVGELRIAGDLRVSLPSGALSIEARDGLALNAGPTLAVQAHAVTSLVDQAQVVCGNLRISGERADSCWLERHDNSLHQHQQVIRHRAEYGDSRRHVQGHEELSAGSVRQRVSKDFSLRGETVDLLSQVSVTLRGPRINLG